MCEEKEVNKGFSLIELLVCVAILAIISIPLLNSFLVAGKTNEKAKEIQRATTLAQNIMETVKSQDLSQLKSLFDSDNLIGLNLTTPYDITNSDIETIDEDTVHGRYEYLIKRIKDGNGEYDVYITLDSALYKTAPDDPVQNEYEQNNYEMPKITNLTGDKIAVIAPDTNMDNTIATYFRSLHLAYIDYLVMTGQEVNDSFPLSDDDIKNLITKETSIVATNDTKLDGNIDTSVVKLVSKIEYSISGSFLVTGDITGLHTEYQVFSKTFESVDEKYPIEQIYLFYNKSDLPNDVVVIENNSIKPTEDFKAIALNIVNQSEGELEVEYESEDTWKVVSNAKLNRVEVIDSKIVSNVTPEIVVDTELVSSEPATDRLFEVIVEVYQSDSGVRTGKKYAELVSTKGE